jgi:hypothetical protein
VEDSQRRELRQILGTLDTEKELDRFSQREKAIEKARQVYRFEQIKAEVILPTLRQIMADLERKGHQTRLQAADSDKVRFDVQVQAATVRRGALLVALERDDPASARVEIASLYANERETVAVEKLDAAFVAGRVLTLLKKLLEPPPAPG